MIRKVPCQCSKEDVLSVVDMLGFEGTYDYFFLPGFKCGRSNMGFAFINFKAPALASAFQVKMKDQKLEPRGRKGYSTKICEVVVATIQGLQPCWEQFEQKIHRRQWVASVFIPEPEKVHCLPE